MYFLDSAMRHVSRLIFPYTTFQFLGQGNYSIDREAAEPDPHVIDLNTELSECDDVFSTRVPKQARQ